MGKRNEGSETGIIGRLLWGVVGAGLTATVLTVSGLGLAMPIIAGASVAMGLLVAWGGPMLLDLLNLV